MHYYYYAQVCFWMQLKPLDWFGFLYCCRLVCGSRYNLEMSVMWLKMAASSSSPLHQRAIILCGIWNIWA